MTYWIFRMINGKNKYNNYNNNKIFNNFIFLYKDYFDLLKYSKKKKINFFYFIIKSFFKDL